MRPNQVVSMAGIRISSLDHARQVIEEWRIDYNRHRPHSSLGDLSAEEFMRRLTTTEVGAL